MPADPKPSGEPADAPQQQQQVRVDDSNVSSVYANFCRLSGTFEELVLDFALNQHPTAMPEELKLNQRVILNYYTAKRLLHALAAAVQRHEAAFGALEVDVRKRVVTHETSDPPAK